MAYQVLTLKYRPQKLSDLCGQEHIVTSLINCFKRNNIPNVFLFSGQYGSGKTTVARIMAAMLNCEKGVTTEPCGKCFACNKIRDGMSIDIQEIDAATNRGINEIRSLKESVRYSASEMRYKVVILDECHALTEEANTALLKLLEEPPDNLFIFLCTTDPRKMLPTIHSRCMRFTFKKLFPSQIYEHLKNICAKESIEYEDEALRVISKISNGSLRDAISNLEALRNFSENKLIESDCYKLFGIPDASFSYNIVEKIIDKKATEGIIIINELSMNGTNVVQMLKEINLYLRNLLILKTCKDHSILEITGPYLKKMKEQSNRINVKSLLDIMKIFEETFSLTTYNLNVQHVLEKAFVESIISIFNEEASNNK